MTGLNLENKRRMHSCKATKEANSYMTTFDLEITTQMHSYCAERGGFSAYCKLQRLSRHIITLRDNHQRSIRPTVTKTVANPTLPIQTLILQQLFKWLI